MNALLLVGSPKGRQSASYVLGSKLAEMLRERGVSVGEFMAGAAWTSEEATARLLEAVDASDLVVLSFPLYVDSLPAPLVRVLESVAVRRAGAVAGGPPRLAVIVQCGFPETSQCDAAVGVCRLFAGRAGMRWAGALAMGMGGSVGSGIERLPGGGKAALEALGMAAESLASGGVIPQGATERFAGRLMPRWLYLLVGNLGWRLQMRQRKSRRPMAYRPYAQD